MPTFALEKQNPYYTNTQNFVVAHVKKTKQKQKTS